MPKKKHCVPEKTGASNQKQKKGAMSHLSGRGGVSSFSKLPFGGYLKAAQRKPIFAKPLF